MRLTRLLTHTASRRCRGTTPSVARVQPNVCFDGFVGPRFSDKAEDQLKKLQVPDPDISIVVICGV